MPATTSGGAVAGHAHLGSDGGPIYRETMPGRFPVEPWNMVSLLAFLALVPWGFRRIGREWRRQGFVVASLSILCLGSLGGLLYHATRSSRWFLALDIGSILLLALMAAAWFWRRVLRCWPRGIAATLAWLVIQFLLAACLFLGGLPHAVAISLNYAVMALGILLPVALHLARTRWTGGSQVALALAAFAAAALARALDHRDPPLLPMGTHWLWHLLGVLATWALTAYLIRDCQAAVDRDRLAPAGGQRCCAP